MTAPELIAAFKKQPIGYSCGLVSVICGALIYFTSSQIEEKEATYEAKSAEAAKILANVRNAAKLPEQVAEVQALAKELETRLIRAGQLAVNQQFFYKLEAETEVKMNDLRQVAIDKAGKPGAQFAAIPFNVTLQGSFKQLLAFLQRLENGPHFCRIKGINFTKGGGGTEAGSALAGPDAPMMLSLNLELLGTP